MKLILQIILYSIVLKSFVQAQSYNSTIGTNNNDSLKRDEIISTYKKGILIVPYKPMFYHSQIDNKLFEYNSKYTIQSIRDEVCYSLLSELSVYFKLMFEKNKIIHLQPKESKNLDIIENIFSLKSEQYTPLYTEEKQDTSSYLKLKNKLSMSKQKTNSSKMKEVTHIKSGQLASTQESSEKFMSANIKDKNAFSKLFEYPNDAYLFINQIDLLYKPLAYNTTPMYIVQIHFTFMNNQLNVTTAGIEAFEFSESELIIDNFAKKVINPLSKKLTERCKLSLN